MREAWTICEQDEGDYKKWVDAIRLSLGLRPKNPTDPADQEVIQPWIIVPLPSPSCRTAWDYE